MKRIITKEELEEIKMICWNHIDDIEYKKRNKRLITNSDLIVLRSDLETLEIIKRIEEAKEKGEEII